MRINKQTKEYLSLEIEFIRLYLFAFAFLFFGSILLVVYGLTDNVALTNLHLIFLLIGFLFLLLAGSKEVVLDKKKGKIIVNYRRNIYQYKKTYPLSDLINIVYKVRSNRGFSNVSYNYYLKLKKGKLIFLDSSGVNILSQIKNRDLQPQLIVNLAKFLGVKIRKIKFSLL
jgi:hypothetical protein